MDAKEIGADIQRVRKRGKFSRRELAVLAGIGPTAIYELEKGVGKTKLSTLLSVLNTLNIRLILQTPFMEQPTPNKAGD